MRLYEIQKSYETLKNFLEQEDLNEEDFEEAFKAIEGDLTDKARNMTFIIKEQEADIAKHDEEIKRLTKRKKVLENSVARIKDNLFTAMVEMDQKDIDTGFFKLKIQKNAPSVNILDEKEIGSKWWRIETIEKLDRRGILEALKNGEEVNGAEMVQSESLRIR